MFHCLLNSAHSQALPTNFHIPMNGAPIFPDSQIFGDSHLLPPLNSSWTFFCSKPSWHIAYKLTHGIHLKLSSLAIQSVIHLSHAPYQIWAPWEKDCAFLNFVHPVESSTESGTEWVYLVEKVKNEYSLIHLSVLCHLKSTTLSSNYS